MMKVVVQHAGAANYQSYRYFIMGIYLFFLIVVLTMLTDINSAKACVLH
jgi:hypothetical protein